ncbi:glycoside hydrolase family 16 protein [Terrihabitans sp. B22-R8]|uniref:glycoside hydrolase family 16 protein n=1 Tax=Terrihabitans sp. B22-R8 TaxID=3425128 RepID=UPI00403C9A5E
MTDLNCRVFAFALLISIAAFTPVEAQQAANKAERLNLDGYRLVFADEFDDLDVSPWGPGTRWIAHTPWNGDFGDAKFVDPRPGFPFTVSDGILRIEARKNEKGRWESGLLAGHNLKGSGFAQQYGYFEMRAKLPPGPGVWPAFWLMGIERTRYAVEIDVLELYGRDPRSIHSVYHIWSMDKVYPARKVPHVARFDFDLTETFHRFGVLVAPDVTTFYLDGESYWQIESPPEFAQPLFPLLNLALGSGWPITDTPNPSYMYVDYVRIYAK